MNGLWQFELAAEADGANPPFGVELKQTILVPFPLESCLSGAFQWPTYSKYMWYRKLFDAPASSRNSTTPTTTLLHFGAVDWNSTVYLNGVLLGNHVGGYDGFTFTLPASLLKPAANELMVHVFDPSNEGFQPHGKQRLSAIGSPGGDTYTPTSGIWQTVWLEVVPQSYWIDSISIRGDAAGVVHLTVKTAQDVPGIVSVSISLKSKIVVSEATGTTFQEMAVQVPAADVSLWHPDTPTLYDVQIAVHEPSTGNTDAVTSYVGLRSISKIQYTIPRTNKTGTRPAINGKFTYLAGWLDQSWWPDGEYTAPTDEALKFDLQAVKDYGFNMVRLHQKVNSERWYYWADVLGVVVVQDAVQKYGEATNATREPFLADLKAMMDGRGNHPSIVQWVVFNEGDCEAVFNITEVVEWAQAYDPHRLIDTNSGGPGNALKIADVNDVHTYPWPGAPEPSATQYTMVGEFGGIGAFISGHEWQTKSGGSGCFAYLVNPDAQNMTDTYLEMVQLLQANRHAVSASVFTQITDVENECDGMYTMDRINKLDPKQLADVKRANAALIAGTGGDACPTSTGWFNPFASFIEAGGDVLKNGSYTLAAAQAKCIALPGCSGITFKDAAPAPTSVISNVYFKNHTMMQGGVGWWAYMRC